MKEIRLRKDYFVLSIVLFGIMLFILKLYSVAYHEEHQLQGMGTAMSPFLIEDEADFNTFAHLVNEGNTYTGQYIRLENDIDYSLIRYVVGVADSDITFAGLFDGNGHAIKNVNIKADKYAGIFTNLSGTVCNLIVKGGVIQAEFAGAITSTIYESAQIFNCQNYAAIEGESQDGMAGRFSGNMKNCVSGTQSMDIEEYNEALDVLSTTMKYTNWCKWKETDEGVSLSNEKAIVLEKIVAPVEVYNYDVELLAYYGMNGIWYIALPSGYTEEKIEAQLYFSDGSSMDTDIGVSGDVVTVAHGGREYMLQCVKAEGIPTMYFSTEKNNSVEYLRQSKENYISGNVTILDEQMQLHYKGAFSELSGRGNHSWREAPKKGYNLVLQHGADLFGMGYNKDYVLIAGYRDNSLLTYKVVQDLEKELGIAFAPESRFVNVYIDHEYYGMYLLTEKIEIDLNRYEITDVSAKMQQIIPNKLSEYVMNYSDAYGIENARAWYDIPVNPNDISGGYILELNNRDYDEDKSRFETKHNMTLTLKSDKYATKEQVDYIADYWQDFEDAVFSKDGYNDKGKHYTEYIDLESFADQWLMYELNSEVAMTDSVYFYKESDVDGDGLLHAGYVWDVEHSFTSDAEHMYILDHQARISENYWGRLYEHPDFARKVEEEWNNRFYPAVCKLFVDNMEENPDGVSSLAYYLHRYALAAQVNQTRWEKCNWENKVVSVQEHLAKKSQFLSQALTSSAR